MSTKVDKELFVSGHSGTSLGEICLLTITVISGYLLRCVLTICLPRIWQANLAVSFLIEYATVVLPGVLVFTVLADYAFHVLLFIFLTSCAISVYYIKWNNIQITNGYKLLSITPYPSRLPCVTLTRTYVTLITAIAILAVDFHIFPRRLAKAETYGIGLMDVGVGAFLMAHGITSPEARDKKSSMSYGRLVFVTVKSLLPLFVIGLLRLMAVKSTDYQEHVTEYGVHWNFFFTIVAVRFLATLLHPLLNALPHLYGVAAILTALGYQLALSRLSLSDYIINGPYGDGTRPTLFSANREGVCSCVGYLAIYLGHIEMGRWLFKPRRYLGDYWSVYIWLITFNSLLYLGTVGSHLNIEPISRRLVNLAYICWIFSYGATIIGLFLLIDFITYTLALASHAPPPSLHTPHPSHNTHPHKQTQNICIVSAVDYNQLGFFLLANLLTGLVNFSMDTLSASWVTSLIVLLVYMTVLVCVFVVLLKHRIKIKL